MFKMGTPDIRSTIFEIFVEYFRQQLKKKVLALNRLWHLFDLY